jgi:hypothetical protein
LVTAATQKEGVRYVYTSSEEWIPFDEVLESYPIESILDQRD